MAFRNSNYDLGNKKPAKRVGAQIASVDKLIYFTPGDVKPWHLTGWLASLDHACRDTAG